jgi:hypothetical protein
MTTNRPFVTIATACDNILAEADGVLSVIRIVDRYAITALHQFKDQFRDADIALPIKALICLKSGDFQGEGELSLKIQLPDATRKDFPEKWTLLMEGEEKGVNINLEFGMSSKHIGLSWIEIYWNNEFLSKFPIRLSLDESQQKADAKNS